MPSRDGDTTGAPALAGAQETGDDSASSFTEARITALEARVEEQDAALRRVLTLLVDWVEADARGPQRGVLDHAA